MNEGEMQVLCDGALGLGLVAFLFPARLVLTAPLIFTGPMDRCLCWERVHS